MTVKQLKEKLNTFDDNLNVLITTDDYSYVELVGVSQGVNEADGCLFLDNYKEDDDA